MKKYINQKPTKKHNSTNPNQKFNFDYDPFPFQQQYYKDQKQNSKIQQNQSQQTDIDDDIDISQLKTKRITWFQTKQQKSNPNKYLNIVSQPKDKIFTKIQKKKQQFTNSIQSDGSNIDLQFQNQQKSHEPLNKKKKYKHHIKPQTLKRHMQQIDQKIAKSNYPQNVMHRIHPVLNISSNEHQQVLNDKQVKFNKDTKKTVKITAQKNVLLENRKQNWNINLQSVQQNNKKRLLCANKPSRVYQQVEWSLKQAMIIQYNIKWLSRIIIRQQIQNIFGQQYLKQNNQNDNQIQLARQHLLQLKCILRYRSIVDILKKLKDIIIAFQQHGQPLININRYSQYNIQRQINQNYIDQINNKVIQAFTKLIFSFVIQYSNASKQNKLFIKQLYQKRGFIIQTLQTLSGQRTKIWPSINRKLQQKAQMLEQQRLFEPYKKKMRQLKWRNYKHTQQQLRQQSVNAQQRSITYSLIQQMFPLVEAKRYNQLDQVQIDRHNQRLQQRDYQQIQIDKKYYQERRNNEIEKIQNGDYPSQYSSNANQDIQI